MSAGSVASARVPASPRAVPSAGRGAARARAVRAHRAKAPSSARRDASARVASAAAPSPSPSPSARPAPPAGAPVEEKFWEWEGHRIRYTCAGEEGPAMILVHGFGGNADHWRKNTPALGRRGRVFAIDLLGYGYSDKPNPLCVRAPTRIRTEHRPDVRRLTYPRARTPSLRSELEQNAIYNFENWSRQLRAFASEVVGEPAFIMCNSVGGVAGLQAAVDDPSLVRGVVLINVSLRGLHIKKQPAPIRPFVKLLQNTLRTTDIGRKFFGNVAQERTVRNILKEAYGDPAAVTDELVECILKPGLQPGAAEVFLDFISYSGGPLPEELLPAMPPSVPVRILWGQADPWEVVREGRAYGEFECVDKFVELPGVGHCPMDEAPDLVNPLLMEFVEDYRGCTAGAP